jgi:soluble lytic murein transglycosylase-like protein
LPIILIHEVNLRAQLILLIALCTLILSGGTVEPTPYVWPSIIAQKSDQQVVYSMQEREADLWDAIVRKVADDLLIPNDLELAGRITRAIEASSAEFGVDPWLMVALIRVESAGNPAAVSYLGARGLTQVMPATGSQIARELGVEWTGPQMLHDVETSVRFGTYYLSTLLERFGDVHAAVAAYYWGPENIARRIRAGKPLPTGYPGKVFRHVNVAQIWSS